MICEKCGVNNATTLIRNNVNGVKSEKLLCSSCAESEGYTVNHSDFSKFLLFGDANTVLPKQLTRCSCCGFTINDITKNGKCGCDQCYNIFYDQLLPYIKKAQYGRRTHKGKTPNAQAPVLKSPEQELQELKALLGELIKAEKYEQAAEVRDRIKLLEEGIQ